MRLRRAPVDDPPSGEALDQAPRWSDRELTARTQRDRRSGLAVERSAEFTGRRSTRRFPCDLGSRVQCRGVPLSRAMTALFWLLVFVVLLALFGWAIAGFVWTVLWYVLVGVVIGGVARVLVRGTGRYGMGMTIIAGIAGSLLGGLLANVLDTGWFVQFLLAVLAAAVLIAITASKTKSA